MIYAIRDSQKITATPGQTAECPCCNTEVISKCGDINIWHWAHKAKENACIYKDETNWHREMKSLFDPDMVEIRVENQNGVAIADVLLPDGTAIEFQHSAIDIDTIQRRKLIHKKIIWVFDLSPQFDRDQIKSYTIFGKQKLKYRRPKKILRRIYPKLLYLYLGRNLFYKPDDFPENTFIENEDTGYNERYFYFTGKLINKEQFISSLNIFQNSPF